MTPQEDICGNTKIARIHVDMCYNRDGYVVLGGQMTGQSMISHFEFILQMVYH